MKTGKYDKNGIEISVGDIVHFRCKHCSLSGEGVVYLSEDCADRLGKDIRNNKNKGRLYPWYNDAVYTIKKQLKET